MDTHGVPPPDWQVDAEARIAGWKALFDDVRERETDPVLLVTSNGAARFALLAAGLGSASGLKLPTGGYGVIRRDGRGALALAEWGLRP